MSNPSSDDEQTKGFRRQAPIEEFETDTSEAPKKTRVDEDGTEYEWDPQVRGWFPKVTERYLVEHHMNYGLESQQFQFDLDTNCYTFTGADGYKLRLDADSNRWVPFEAEIRSDGDRRFFMHPHYKMEFTLRSGAWEPSNQSSFTDPNTGVVFIWSRQNQGFVDSRLIEEYEDIITGIHYKWQDDRWIIVGSKENKEEEEEKVKDGCFVLPDNMNRNVYVSNLPTDITDEEFLEMMSKYGLIASDTDTGRPRVKLYKDADGKPKGDGICTYVKVESVELCLNLLDGMTLRDATIEVQRAKFKVKGEYDPAKKRKRKNKNINSKHNKRRLGWDDDGEVAPRPKHERILVLKNIIESPDPYMSFAAISSLKDDVRILFSEYAQVRDVRVFPSTGVVTVALLTPAEADKCIDYVNGRIWKNGNTVDCQRWDGKTKFDIEDKEEDVDEEVIVKRWHDYIEADDD